MQVQDGKHLVKFDLCFCIESTAFLWSNVYMGTWTPQKRLWLVHLAVSPLSCSGSRPLSQPTKHTGVTINTDNSSVPADHDSETVRQWPWKYSHLLFYECDMSGCVLWKRRLLPDSKYTDVLHHYKLVQFSLTGMRTTFHCSHVINQCEVYHVKQQPLDERWIREVIWPRTQSEI